MEIGGYIQWDTYEYPMKYDGGIKLNSGRNALAYVIKVNEIKKIYMPVFMCDSCDLILEQLGVEVSLYSIEADFKPSINMNNIQKDEWIYIVNYYGQLDNEFLSNFGRNIIVDNAQAYYQEPIEGINTIYNCRKFFGVTDGAILFSNKQLDCELVEDYSWDRIKYLFGRYEKTASEFYSDYLENNNTISNLPLMKMSKVTENFLHAIDYDSVEKIRTNNFAFLHSKLQEINELSLTNPKGAFMYPLYMKNGKKIRQLLQAEKIYIPLLWPATFSRCDENSVEYGLAQNILPLPCDQRYGIEEMEIIIKSLMRVKDV